MQHVDTLVVGAGPTGLGAAWRLHEHGRTDWLVVEQADRPGGAARSVLDDHGFTWDLGGHVIHSHYPYFDDVLASCDVEWVYPQRRGYVRFEGAFVPVPFQQNLGSLAPGLLARVQDELASRTSTSPANLDQWFRAEFGPTLTERFFSPFNSKMWAHPPKLLDHGWTSLRSGSVVRNVPPPRVGLSAVHDQTPFPYPRRGAGALWAAVAARLPPEKLWFSTEVDQVHLQSRRVRLSSGRWLSYGHLISSMPLTELMCQTHPGSDRSELLHSSVEVLGFGFDGAPPASLADKSWVYEPDPAVPFHRATFLSNYSEAMAGPGRWSVLLECGTSEYRPLESGRLAELCLTTLQSWGAGTPVSVWRRFLQYGYPVPSLGRDAFLGPVMSELESCDVRSRGRFGGWRYESCNQDHAFMQGVQAVDATTRGGPEDVFWPGRPSPA